MEEFTMSWFNHQVNYFKIILTHYHFLTDNVFLFTYATINRYV